MPQDLHTLDLRLSDLLVLVEEVAAKQHHVHLLLHPDAELLVEAVEAAHAAQRVLLGVTQVIVTRSGSGRDYLSYKLFWDYVCSVDLDYLDLDTI